MIVRAYMEREKKMASEAKGKLVLKNQEKWVKKTRIWIRISRGLSVGSSGAGQRVQRRCLPPGSPWWHRSPGTADCSFRVLCPVLPKKKLSLLSQRQTKKEFFWRHTLPPGRTIAGLSLHTALSELHSIFQPKITARTKPPQALQNTSLRAKKPIDQGR